MNYEAPKGLPPELADSIAETLVSARAKFDPDVVAAIESVLARVGPRFYECGHVDGYALAARQIRADLDSALEGKKAGPRG